MGRKKKQEEAKGGDAWLMTYGDMMSLLLTFFVLIVSFSSIQEAKFNEAASSLKAAFGVMPSQPTVIEMPETVVPRAREKQRQDVLMEVQKLEQTLLHGELDKQVDVAITEKGVTFRIAAPTLFDSGTADLRDETVTVLASLGEFLKKFSYPVVVEGHTDSLPISTVRFPSNWDLSAGRAAAVARYFQDAGVVPDRLSAVGFGEFRPLDSNETLEGRAKNRRVEIFLQMDGELPVNTGLPLNDEEKDHG